MGMEMVSFQTPYGLAFDANNHLYVSDHSNHRVQKFNVDGQYLLKFGHQGSGNGQLYYPIGIAVHNDRVYIAECANNRISVFTLDGNFCCIIGSGQLGNPYGVTISGNGNLLIANYNNGYITSYTLDGTCLGNFNKGQISNPVGLTTDKVGFAFATDSKFGCVKAFAQDGTSVHQFGSNGTENGQFSNPYGIAVGPNGNIYVADYNNKRVQIF